MVRRRVAGKCLQLRHDMRIVLSLCQPVQARFVEDVHLADIFITANPWRPASSLITWAAVMRGCWVLTPETYLCNRGPALKFRPAVQVKRMVWISDAFQAANVSLFLLIAEVLNVGPHAWKVLRGPAEWAEAKVKAERAGRSAQVLALVTNEEEGEYSTTHVFGADSFLKCVAASARDEVRTTIGSAGM